MSRMTKFTLQVSVPEAILKHFDQPWQPWHKGPPPFLGKDYIPPGPTPPGGTAGDGTPPQEKLAISSEEDLAVGRTATLILADPETIGHGHDDPTAAIRDALAQSAIASEVLFIWQQLLSGVVWKTLAAPPPPAEEIIIIED